MWAISIRWRSWQLKRNYTLYFSTHGKLWMSIRRYCQKIAAVITTDNDRWNQFISVAPGYTECLWKRLSLCYRYLKFCYQNVSCEIRELFVIDGVFGYGKIVWYIWRGKADKANNATDDASDHMRFIGRIFWILSISPKLQSEGWQTNQKNWWCYLTQIMSWLIFEMRWAITKGWKEMRTYLFCAWPCDMWSFSFLLQHLVFTRNTTPTTLNSITTTKTPIAMPTAISILHRKLTLNVA